VWRFDHHVKVPTVSRQGSDRMDDQVYETHFD
jgi:hypothetical protein